MTDSRKDVTNDFLGCIIQYLKVKHDDPSMVLQIRTHDGKLEAECKLIQDEQDDIAKAKIRKAFFSTEFDHYTVKELKENFAAKESEALNGQFPKYLTPNFDAYFWILRWLCFRYFIAKGRGGE